jgi:carbamoyl-phosphate synthase large subunit
MRRRNRKPTGIEIYRPAALEAGDAEFSDAAPASGHSSIQDRPVVVTGAAEASGVAAIRLLVAAGYQVVAVDCDRFAPGLRMAQWGAVVPEPEDPDYGVTLAKIAVRTGAKMLIPGAARDVATIQATSDVICEAGLRTWLPDRAVVQLCQDRRSLDERLRRHGHRVATPIERALSSNSRRFEVDLLAARDHSAVGAVAHWHLRADKSLAMVAETFARDDLAELVDSVCDSLAIEGPAVLAGVVSADDAVKITDLTIGLSACTPLCAAAGANLVLAYANAIRGDDLPGARMAYRSGVRMVRHLDEVFEA